MQNKIVKALEEVRELNSQISSLQGFQHTLSSVENQICKACRGGLISLQGKNAVLESGKKIKHELNANNDDMRGR